MSLEPGDPPGAEAEPAAAALPLPLIERVEGPSFPLAIKLIATVWVLALAALVALNVEEAAENLSGLGGKAFAVAVLAAVAAGWWTIVASRTAIDGTSIRQTGLWTREVALADIRRVKLVHVRGLDWIVVPRLIVRGSGLTMATFRAGDPRVLAAFRRLAYG